MAHRTVATVEAAKALAPTVGAEDRPPYLRFPLGRVRGVVPVAQVVLTQRPIDADLVTCHVGTEFAVGEVNVGQRAAMGHDRQLGRGHQDRRLRSESTAMRV